MQARVLKNTLRALIERTHPDLITIAGDLAWAGEMESYENLCCELDQYNIPYAPVWGNHDNQGGPAQVDKQADVLLKHPLCLLEKGDPAMGCGNYVIQIEENGKPVYAMFMVDSHDRMPVTNPDGTQGDDWAHLLPNQLTWYQEEAAKLGCRNSLVMHIPVYEYLDAWNAAWKQEYDPMKITREQAYEPQYWNEEYAGAYGNKYEGVGSYCKSLGEFDALRAPGLMDYMLVGHDHVNNYVINYKGVKLTYILKIGAGCYWTEKLNGGTILSISDKGAELHHEYVDATPWIEAKEETK